MPQTSDANQPKQPLTIEAIFAEGGITGRAPETIQWSPDGKKLSFVQRDDAGEHGEFWYVDAATGEKKVLVSEAKLASLAPDANKIKDEREKERVTALSRRGLPVGARLQASAVRSPGPALALQPGQRRRRAIHFVARPERRSEVFSRRQSHRLSAQAQPVRRSRSRGAERQAAHRTIPTRTS